MTHIPHGSPILHRGFTMGNTALFIPHHQYSTEPNMNDNNKQKQKLKHSSGWSTMVRNDGDTANFYTALPRLHWFLPILLPVSLSRPLARNKCLPVLNFLKSARKPFIHMTAIIGLLFLFYLFSSDTYPSSRWADGSMAKGLLLSVTLTLSFCLPR